MNAGKYLPQSDFISYCGGLHIRYDIGSYMDTVPTAAASRSNYTAANTSSMGVWNRSQWCCMSYYNLL